MKLHLQYRSMVVRCCLIAIGIAVWMAGCLLPSPVVGQPSPSGSSPAEPVRSETISPDVVYGHKAGMALTLDVIRPAEQNGAAVVFVVSGGWNSTWFAPETFRRVELLAQLVQKGYAVILLRHGSAPHFKVPDAVEDVKLAIRFLQKNAGEYGFAADRIGVCGMSAGGHLSLMLGTDTNQRTVRRAREAEGREGTAVGNTARVAAVVAWFPPTDLRDMAGPSRDFPALDFDPARGDDVSPLLQVTADDAPTLLVHGTRDRLVPIRHSQEIRAAMDGAGVACELIEIEGAGHGFDGAGAVRANEASLAWLDRFLLVQPEEGKQ